MVNLELYKIFVIVANELNITKASEKLNISQPAVTKHIKNLENNLQVTLFKRTNKGLELTKTGETLYENLKHPINEIIKIDENFSKNKNICIGSHNHLLNIVFGNCINQFCLEYPDINLDLKCFETNEMLDMLKNRELDIVFSKKVAEFKDKNITYFKLGYLNDIFVANKHSKYIKNPLSIKDLENEVIYVPRKYAQTVERLMKLMNNKNLCLKNSSYSSILELTNKTNSIGLITKEYISNDKLEEFNLVELETEFDLEPVEFGVYYNIDRKNEVNYLIKIIKAIFK